MTIRFCMLFTCCTIFISCRKEKETVIALAEINLNKNIRVNDLLFINDTLWFACGGIRNQEGTIFKSKNKGLSWTQYSSEFPKSIYCIHFLNNEIGIAGGDFIHLWRTDDGGETWYFHWLADQVPVNPNDRPAVRDIKMLNANKWYFCGGENLGEGVIYETHNAGNTWHYSIQQHELRTMEMNQNLKSFVGGHGAAFTFQDSLSTLQQTAFANDFITSSVTFSDNNCVAVSYNGAVYRSSDFGNTWIEIEGANKLFSERINWNKIENKNDQLIAVGNNGFFAESMDGGSSWTLSQLEGEQNLYTVDFSHNEVWAGSDNGKIYRIK